MSIAQFKAMFQGVGWDPQNSHELVTVHMIKTMPALRKISPSRAGRVAAAIKMPGGANAGHQVTETAEHGLMLLAVIARNAERVSRTLTCSQLKNVFQNADKCSIHETQMEMEKLWENAPALKLFKPLTAKQMSRGWKPIKEKICRDLLGVRGVASKAPLAYLTRADLKPAPQAGDLWTNYPDFDSQLVNRYPILAATAAGGVATIAEIEVLGTSKKHPEVNVDNAMLYDVVEILVGDLPWYTHIKPAQQTKDGRWAFRLLDSNLSNTNSRDLEDMDNKNRIKALTWNGDTAN